jgi:hypothetical protein
MKPQTQSFVNVPLDPKLWWGHIHTWLGEKAREHFTNWRQTTPEGQKWWKKSMGGNKAGVSPYYHGYSQPDWMHELSKALRLNDEVMAKYLKMQNL